MTGTARDSLTTAIQSFPADPARAGKTIRAALDESPAEFVRTLISDAEHTVAQRGFRYALILLRDRSVLIPALADPPITGSGEAARLMHHMMSIDRNFVNVLLDGVLRQPVLCAERCGMRVIDLVTEWAEQVTNWRSVTRLCEQGDERLRSKCAILLARYRYSEPVMLARFEDSEPRVRANIVEALRDSDPAKTSALIEHALTDSNDRVAGNACMALYHASDARALSWLAQMLDWPRPEFRITAAWVMGQLGDPRFAVPLLVAINAGDSRLRETAVRALGNLDRLDPGSGRADLCPLFISAPPLAAGVEYWIRVPGRDGRFARGLMPVDFFLSGRRQVLFDYTVEELQGPPSVALRMAWPRENRELAGVLLGSLDHKPASQSWAVACYAETGASALPSAPMFRQDARAIASGIENSVCAEGTASQLCATLPIREAQAVEQHMIFWADGRNAQGPMSSELRKQCRARGIRLHCRDVEDTGPAWDNFLHSLQARYVVKAGSGPAPAALTMRETVRGSARYSKPAHFSGVAGVL